MSFANTRIGKWAASLLVMVAGCNQDTRIEYQHNPTVHIESDHTLSRPELTPFTVDGVVVEGRTTAIGTAL